MIVIKRIAATAFGVAFIAASVGMPVPAAADDVGAAQLTENVFSAQSPEAAYENLSASEQEAFDSYALPQEHYVELGEIEPQDDLARQIQEQGTAPESLEDPQAAGCWHGQANGWAEAAAGNTLYTYFVEGTWCSNGSGVTSASYDRAGGETSTPGWSYEGLLDNDSGISGNRGIFWAQHEFELGSGGWVIQNPTPCIRFLGSAAGNTDSDRTCSVNF